MCFEANNKILVPEDYLCNRKDIVYEEVFNQSVCVGERCTDITVNAANAAQRTSPEIADCICARAIMHVLTNDKLIDVNGNHRESSPMH